MQNRTTSVSKSASAPSLAKQQHAATQAFMAAVGSGNVQAMRTLALECGAELSGTRAYNILGHSPKELLASMDQLTPQQRLQVKQQLIELPRLINAADAAREGASMATTLRLGTSGASTLRPNASSDLARMTRSATVLPKIADKGVAERELRMKGAMATLGESFRDPELLYKAALSNPRLLKSVSDNASPALQALATALRSEELAARAVERCPALLKRSPMRFQQVVPVLMGLLCAEEVAYTLINRPEVLEVERPQTMRETVSMIAEILNSWGDAQWFVAQSIVPASIVVSARAWCNEELVGEFIRLRGKRMHNRPVYKKPAKARKDHGAQARDMYLLYDEGGELGPGGHWIFTANFDERSAGAAGKTRSAFRRAAGGPRILAHVGSELLSPDQAIGTWSVLSGDHLSPDPCFRVADAGAARGRSLLTVPPPRIRSAHNDLKEALGPVWLEGGVGAAAKGTRYIGNLRRDDPLHIGVAAAGAGIAAGAAPAGAAECSLAAGRFGGLMDFDPKKGYGYIQTTVQARTLPLVLTAWEPIVVLLIFYTGPGQDDENGEDQASDQRGASASSDKKKSATPGSKGSKQSSNAGSKAGSKVAPRKSSAAASQNGELAETLGTGSSYWRSLAADGWLPVDITSPGALRMPELRDAGKITQMLSRGFVRGRVEIPPHLGPGPPPLIFVHSQMAARDSQMVPCEATAPARPGEAIYTVSTDGCAPRKQPGHRGSNIGAGEAVGRRGMKVKLVEVNVFNASDGTAGASSEAPSPPCLDLVGDIGYGDGFSMVRPRFSKTTCQPADVHIVIDTEDPIRVAVAWFHLPSPEDKNQVEHCAPPPSWVEGERWRLFESSKPVALLTAQGVRVKASYIYAKDFGPGEIAIRGSGEATAVVMQQSLGQPRPEPLRSVLSHRPALLASGDVFSLLVRRLRIELGSACARRLLLERTEEWGVLCETGGSAEVEEWVAARKMTAFATELNGGVAQAKALVERTVGLAAVTLPQLSENCAVLSDALGGTDAMLALIPKVPEVLTVPATRVRRNLAALGGVFQAKELVRRICFAHPRFLLTDGQLESLFEKLIAHHPDIAQQRLQRQTSGEWARWPDMVGKSREVLASWLGRIVAEERAASCHERVQLSGLRVSS